MDIISNIVDHIVPYGLLFSMPPQFPEYEEEFSFKPIRKVARLIESLMVLIKYFLILRKPYDRILPSIQKCKALVDLYEQPLLEYCEDAFNDFGVSYLLFETPIENGLPYLRWNIPELLKMVDSNPIVF